MVKFYHIDDMMEEAASVRSANSMDEEEQNFELDEEEVAIIIDSGADAPILLASMIHCGRDHDGKLVALQDAQENQIPVLEQKSASILLGAHGGAEIELRDNVIFSNDITLRSRCRMEHLCREHMPEKWDLRIFFSKPQFGGQWPCEKSVGPTSDDSWSESHSDPRSSELC